MWVIWGDWRSFRCIMMLWTYLAGLIPILYALDAMSNEGFIAYQQQSIDRCDLIYSQILPERIKARHEEGALIAEFLGFPYANVTRGTHLQGSPIEAETNKEVLMERVERLIDRYGRETLAFKVLENWASPEFYEVLESHGYRDVELSTIMSVASFNDLVPQLPLPDGYRMERITYNKTDLIRFGKVQGASVEWIIDLGSDAILGDPRFAFWQVIHDATNTLACTALVECVNGLAGLHMVETMVEHRRKGLASALVYHACAEAFREHPGLKRLVLGSTPEALNLYKRLGFITYGHYRSYDYVGLDASMDINASIVNTEDPTILP